MADRPSKKNPNAVSKNDARSNGKASKTRSDGYFGRDKAFRGSHTRPTHLSELQKALLGGGAMRRITRPVPDKTPIASK